MVLFQIVMFGCYWWSLSVKKRAMASLISLIAHLLFHDTFLLALTLVTTVSTVLVPSLPVPWNLNSSLIHSRLWMKLNSIICFHSSFIFPSFIFIHVIRPCFHHPKSTHFHKFWAKHRRAGFHDYDKASPISLLITTVWKNKNTSRIHLNKNDFFPC